MKALINRTTLVRLSQAVACVVLLLTSQMHSSAQVQVLDDFNSGNININRSMTVFDNLPEVFGGSRFIALTKENEFSATSISVGAGVLTWNETGRADVAHVGYGMLSTLGNLAAYNALRLTVNSAPPNACRLWVGLAYFDSGTTYGSSTPVYLPTSGTVDIPFSAFSGLPSLDLRQVNTLSLTFDGSFLTEGSYSFDDFEVVTVPEPSMVWLGVTACAFLVRKELRPRTKQIHG